MGKKHFLIDFSSDSCVGGWQGLCLKIGSFILLRFQTTKLTHKIAVLEMGAENCFLDSTFGTVSSQKSDC